ncbi:AhpC/TSA family protein [Arcticibacter svalbardensis MN12-7]|uniref:AhpC/TSA family protein n=1 Tax=Arcticibacter svalbardensis MN12-7 TaxID=1150600 RepID=R9GY88_9SPHI|nr:redoxin domain-containing protein [Arcticibacter svalbardensis]EOR96696.1 AhpC/TSA family protein [Arcticibacter svalbardensis MN12-7]
MRKLIVFIWLILLGSGVFALFWYNEWQYTLPTPVPKNYSDVAFGKQIMPDKNLSFKNNKPLFLHFFNPDCPCSRFNIKHFKSLVSQYEGKVNFVVVLLTDKYYTPEEVQKKFDLKVPVVVDPDMALQCGVYSTPQAAIIDKNHKLYYRGNYNQSRYCTNEKTEYAKIALMGLLQNNKHLVFNQFALTAYGCRLPNCTQ